MKVGRSSLDFHKIHNYFVGDEIASGSFSSIRTALDNKTFKNMVIKVISKRKIDKCPSGIDMYFAEAYLAPNLVHPHILKITDMIEASHHLMQAMDYYERGDLCQYLQNHNVPTSTKIKMIDEVLSAIEYLHSMYICHRDIKPDNVLLTDNLSTKLTDFGFSTFSNGCMNEGLCGSKEYVAPEVKGNKSYDGRKADIYSIGKFIYFVMLPGADLNNIDYRLLPKKIANLVKSCLQIDPDQRPTIKEIRNHECFDELKDNKVVNPAIDIDSPITWPDQSLLVLLSEMYEEDYEELTLDLKSEETTDVRIMYHLLSRNKPTDSCFKSNSDSQLTKAISQMNSLKTSTFEFKSTVYDLINTIHRSLFRYNFCISTSANGTKTVVLNRAKQDISLKMNIIIGEKKIQLKIIHNNETSHMVDEISALLKSQIIE